MADDRQDRRGPGRADDRLPGDPGRAVGRALGSWGVRSERMPETEQVDVPGGCIDAQQRPGADDTAGIGPERLPKVARQAGQWTTKMRRYVDDVKSDFNRQIELSELRDLKKDVEEAARSIEGSVGGAMTDMKSSLDSVQRSLELK